MASSSGRCLVNRNNYGGELERDPRYRPDEIYLYYNNTLVVKAERGVTLGLIKLIYTSDDNNPGLLLGVRPRLRDKVPCLITFDSTSLMHDAYDLIVHDSITSGESIQQNTTDISNNNDYHQAVSYMHPPEREQPMLPPVSHSSHISHPSYTSNDWQRQIPLPPAPLQTSPPAHQPAVPQLSAHPPTTTIPPSTTTAPQTAPPATQPAQSIPQQPPDSSASASSSFEEVFNQHLNQTLQEVGTMEAERSIRASTRRNNDNRPTMAFRNKSRDDDDEDDDDDASNESTPEPDSTETPEKFPFKPENFDFDIKSVTPIQTESGLRWPCDRCNKHYCSASHLKRHWILHTDFRPYCCTLCDKKFPFHWDLKRHMTKHTGIKRFKCSSCDKSFNTQKELKCHGWLHTGKKLYKCQVCNHELSSSGNLKVHMRKHTGVKPYKCEYCPRAFYMLGHYQYHKMRHTGIKPYKCEICGKTFSFSLNLREHNNIHTGEKPYSCTKCDKKFAHRSTLKQHILVHGGERPYKCHICSKDFVQSSNYRMHLLTHQDKELRIQKCDLCGKELISRRWVTKHRQKCLKKMMQEKDGKPKEPKEPRKEYKCETCSKVFKYRANYESHLKKAHIPGAEEPKKTKIPKKPPKEPKEAKATKKSVKNSERNRISCPICDKKFQFVSGVKKHLQKRHAGVEMAIPQNLESTSDLKDSSFAITSGEDSRVIIRSASSTNSDGTTSVKDVAKGEKIEIVPIGQPVPTIHIQPTGKTISSQKNLTFIFVPSSNKSSPTKSSMNESKESNVLSSSNSSATSPEGDNITNDKEPETGSQAISALKKLNAQFGSPNYKRGTVKSKHLSAIEQLNKKIGNDKSVALETVHTVSRDMAKSSEQSRTANVSERHDGKVSGDESGQQGNDSGGGQE